MYLEYQKNNMKTTYVSGKKGEACLDLKQGILKSVASKLPENLHVKRDVMEEILSGEKLKQAYKNVIHNKGSAGIDGMTVDELLPYLQENWKRIKLELLEERKRIND